jgi:hypothetical protein
MRWLTIVLVGLLSTVPAARAATFSSSCDRFEIDGNTFGPHDGTIDFADDFDGGSLAPSWSVLLGTAEEAGTDVTAHDPGTNVPLGPTTFQISTVENAVHEIDDGGGDFTMTSRWEPVVPGTDNEFHMQLYTQGPIIEAAGLSVNNLSPGVATQQGNGALAGYSINQSLTRGVGTGFTTVQSNSVAIDPMQVAGHIALRMSFDDATNMLTCSFSLDGGATFLSPFPPIHIFNMGVTDYDVLLGAAALLPSSATPPVAQGVPLGVLSVKNPSGPESRRVTYKAVAPRDAGLTLFGNPLSGGATFKVKLDAVTQCFSMPAAGWSRFGPTFRYRDPGGVYGPIKVAQWRQTGNGAFVNKVVITGKNGQVDIVPPDPGVQGDTNFHVVVGNADYCASTAGGTINPNDGETFKAKKAPAPTYCNVNACSPSGAFLEMW